jgi:hypothetical protein
MGKDRSDQPLVPFITFELMSCVNKLSLRDQKIIAQIDWSVSETSPSEDAALDRLVEIYQQNESNNKNNIA